MKLHKIISLLAVPALLAPLASCDDISEDDRIKPVDKIESDRVVLIQEFSGQNCRNCPDGADAVRALLEQYPDNFVAVTMEPANTAFTTPAPLFSALVSEQGTFMYDYYGRPDAFPCAVFNGDEDKMSSNYAQWAEMGIMGLLEPPAVSVNVEADYSAGATEEHPDGRVVKAHYEIEFLEESSDNLNVVVWLTESNIKAVQNVHGIPNVNYIHNHILRDTFTGKTGLSIGNSFKIDQKVEGDLTLSIDPAWDPANCHVIAYVYRTADKIVEQAATTHVEVK